MLTRQLQQGLLQKGVLLPQAADNDIRLGAALFPGETLTLGGRHLCHLFTNVTED